MANIITSPNMNLPIPVQGQDPGPGWADNLNASLGGIDQHDHSSGKGVQVTPDGLNINADLPFGTNNATGLRSSRYDAQSVALSDPADLGCTYVTGVDLYYNDVNGNQIRLTQGGSIIGTAGSISGLPSGTASASYAAGTFVWQSATNTAADMDMASAIMRNNTPSSHSLTLSPPSAIPSDYSLTLPQVPVTTGFMTLDSSGNMGASVPTSGGIVNNNIANGTIQNVKLAASNIIVSGSSGNSATSSTSFITISALTVTLTTVGRPVVLQLVPDGSGNTSTVGISGSSGNGIATMYYRILANTSPIAEGTVSAGTTNSFGASNTLISVPASSVGTIYYPTAGTYVFEIQIRADTLYSGTCYIQWAKFFAYEL